MPVHDLVDAAIADANHAQMGGNSFGNDGERAFDGESAGAMMATPTEFGGNLGYIYRAFAADADAPTATF